MSARDRAGTLRKVVDLRERRVELARRAVADAQAQVSAAEAQLAERDGRIAACETRKTEMDRWLTGGSMTDARYIETALARREAAVDAKAKELRARLDDVVQLEEAQALKADALAALALAEAKREACQGQLDGARKTLDQAREERVQAEFEDRSAPRALRLIEGGRA